ncbi:MAG: Type 1 glutamine amidotransferase-like domain-containing protein [Deltaproteobacteria bacterium]|nr:Type 1 glutamine amidotransferase-like domain-containing protein [Deltaproteobacteria bacterium]
MRGTALVYSSHNRGDHIHNDFIVQRALRGTDNKRILFLPISETVQNGSETERQDFSWGTFRWYFDFYEKHGLEYFPFYWRSTLRREDVDKLWYELANAEVVILGGGHSVTGLRRYKELGARFADGEWGKFGRLLHERQRQGKLTVGFSAGADQLCETLFRESYDVGGDNSGFGLVRNVMCTLHHDPSRDSDLAHAARRNPHFMIFGLPNDAGLLVDQGVLPSGLWWQVIRFVIDKSWPIESDYWHIRTRRGAKIDHFGKDGNHWGFGEGDYMVRIQSPDNRLQEAWMIVGGEVVHYGTRQPSRYRSISEILADH